MNRSPVTRTSAAGRPRRRRRPGRFLFLIFILVLVLLLLGFQLWEIGMAILVYIYLDWCFKS
jgi:type VI protein secretion system component VasF